MVQPKKYDKKTQLLKEKDRLNELLNDTDAQVTKWVKKAEEAFEFATDARFRFNYADPEKKREFVAALAGDSNLSLLDKNVSLQTKSPYFIIKERVKRVPETKPSFEPPKNGSGSGSLDSLYDKNLSLRGYQDSNLEKRVWSPLCYHYTIPPTPLYATLFLLRLLVHRAHSAKFAEFIQFEFFLNGFFVAPCKMRYFFALPAGHFD